LHHAVKLASELRSFFRDVRRLTCGPAGAVLSPGKLEPEKIEPRGARFAVPAEWKQQAFGGGQLKSELL